MGSPFDCADCVIHCRLLCEKHKQPERDESEEDYIYIYIYILETKAYICIIAVSDYRNVCSICTGIFITEK